MYAAAAAAVWFLYGQTDDAVDILYVRAEQRIINWRALEADLRAPGSGLQHIDPNVLAAVGLLREHAVPDFQDTPAVRLAGSMHQRIAEIAWPIPYSSRSRFRVRLRTEPSSPCTPMGAAAEVVLDRCQ